MIFGSYRCDTCGKQDATKRTEIQLEQEAGITHLIACPKLSASSCHGDLVGSDSSLEAVYLLQAITS